MHAISRIARMLAAAIVVCMSLPSWSQAGLVTGSPVGVFTTSDSSKDNVLTQATPSFVANLSTYATFTGEVHSLLGVVNNNESDFEHQDASSPDGVHGDIALPYAMVGRKANGANGTVLYKFVTESGYVTAAGGTITANMYFRHEPDTQHGDNAWIGVSTVADVAANFSGLDNDTAFTRVTMSDLFSGGFATYTGVANLSIPEGVSEFYVAFSDVYNANFSSARLAITSLDVNANLVLAVPEPGCIALLAIGSVLVFVRR